jgi:hypothetical protein
MIHRLGDSAERGHAHEAERQERDLRARQRGEAGGHRAERVELAPLHGRRDRVARILRPEEAVQDQLLSRDAEGLELVARALGLEERGALGPRDEHERRACRVDQRGARVRIELALRREARERTEARGAAQIGRAHV